ncbi:uncharacterized protein KGF55_000973 [Candida pseudojiufengensis]|uniref:uncharacterized protein n=1 Tax=Candida pseudojiufengensis TaxID=497109 RepID=UPI0022255F35|nr:uncharacterized protein KGF55_000973 [Candida pseudojiufengensis]KAI5965611.1 hypothetical protein KGF55_000973 [Candida pseudojiufengensis]
MSSSSSIQITKEELPKVELSILPMHIHYSGPANTSDYFTPSKTKETLKDGSIVDTAYFRGLRLIGKELELKDSNLKGFILNKTENLSRDINEEDGVETIKTIKNYTAISTFEKLTLYGHDSEVESNNQWSLIPEYMEVNSIVHE